MWRFSWKDLKMMRGEISCFLIAFQARRLRLFHLISGTHATGPHPVTAPTRTVLWATACFTEHRSQAGSSSQPTSLEGCSAAVSAPPSARWWGGGCLLLCIHLFPPRARNTGYCCSANSETVRRAGGCCLARTCWVSVCDSGNPNLHKTRWKNKDSKDKSCYADYMVLWHLPASCHIFSCMLPETC